MHLKTTLKIHFMQKIGCIFIPTLGAGLCATSYSIIVRALNLRAVFMPAQHRSGRGWKCLRYQWADARKPEVYKEEVSVMKQRQTSFCGKWVIAL